MPRRNLVWTVLIVAAGVATVLITRKPPPPRPDDPELLRFRPLVAVQRRLSEEAYRPAEAEDVLRGAARGLVEQLDEYSTYVPPDKARSLDSRLDGLACGVGLRLDAADGNTVVAGALPQSPGHLAGVVPGSVVVSVDERAAGPLAPQAVQAMLDDGPLGSSVRLTVVEPGGQQRTWRLTRARFPLETVVGFRRLGDGQWDHWLDRQREIAYVRIKEFVPGTAETCHHALRQLSRRGGLVLDLRQNPGGRLESGFAVADMLLRKGVILTKVDRSGRRESHSAQGDGTLPAMPLVVLIDDGTASAAELVAGALRLHDRAVLVGTRTRGKGCIQSVISLPEGLGQASITTAEFLIGLDEPISRRRGGPASASPAEPWGVDPHRAFALGSAQRQALFRRWEEAELAPVPPDLIGPATRLAAPPAHLPEAGRASGPAAPAAAPGSRPADPYLTEDGQLALALELLKNPAAMAEILARAAAEREALQKARRPAEVLAPRPAASRPAATGASAPDGRAAESRPTDHD